MCFFFSFLKTIYYFRYLSDKLKTSFLVSTEVNKKNCKLKSLQCWFHIVMLIVNQNLLSRKTPLQQEVHVVHCHVSTVKRDQMFIAFSDVSCHVNVFFQMRIIDIIVHAKSSNCIYFISSGALFQCVFQYDVKNTIRVFPQQN